MVSFVQLLDFAGTFAFAISGIRLASAKRFDWFGAYVVGFATAIGGGTLRDILLTLNILLTASYISTSTSPGSSTEKSSSTSIS